MNDGKHQQDRIKKVEIVEVVKIDILKGDGTEGDPLYLEKQYWTKNGRFLGKQTKD